MSESDILNRLKKERLLLRQRCDELLSTSLVNYEIDDAVDAFNRSSDDVMALQEEVDILFEKFGEELKALCELLQELPKAISEKIKPYKPGEYDINKLSLFHKYVH